MSELKMTEKMKQDLTKYLAVRTVEDVNRNTYNVCNLVDDNLKLKFSIVFLKDCDTLDVDDYKEISIQDKGCVLLFPCHWISVAGELAIPYIEYVINSVYENTISTWSCCNNINTPIPVEMQRACPVIVNNI